MYRCKKTIRIRRQIVSRSSLWMKKKVTIQYTKQKPHRKHKLPPRKKKSMNAIDDLISSFGKVRIIDYSVITKEKALRAGSLLGQLLTASL
jgi:hypothetical protein